MGNVNSEIARIEQAKDNIEAAIENCGVDVPDTELISDYATYINKIPEAVFAQFQLAKQGGTDEYIESIEQVNGTISVATGGLASTEASGLMSKEDKITLDLIKAQSTPIIFGQDTDTLNKWTGVSDQITEYYEGLSIIYVPTKSGLKNSTTLQLNELGAVKVILLGSPNAFLANMPMLLIYIDGQWVHKDLDTIQTIPNELFEYRTQLGSWIWFYSDVVNITGFNTKAYAILWVTEDIQMSQNNMQIAIGKTSSKRSPLLINGSGLYQGTYIPTGHYIAYYDEETCYINTDGTIPGKIEKAALAETVEWNEVEGDNGDVSIGESSVTNSLYLYTHNLTHLSKKPSEYKNQYLTAWFSNTDMPLAQTCSGINVSSSSTKVNWQLCSQASNTYDSAYDRLWFRSGLGESWNPWQQVAFINDLKSFKVKQQPVEDTDAITLEQSSNQFVSKVTQNENGEIEVTKQTIQASDLGLTNVMRYIGKSSTAITDGGTQNPTIGGATVTQQPGDVVIDSSDKKEYIWNGTNWEEFGKEGNYKVIQTYVGSPSVTGPATEFIDTITQDTQGKISATKKYIPKASYNTYGIVKVGDNLETDSNGVLSAIGYTYDNDSFTEGDSDSGNRYATYRSHMEGVQADVASLLNYSYTLNPLNSEYIQAKFTPVFNWAAGSADIPSLDGNLYVLVNTSYALNMVEYLLSEPNETSLSIGLSNISGYGEITHTSSGQSFQCLAIYINLSDILGTPCIIPVVLTFDSIPSDLVGSTFKFKNIQSYADQMSHVEGVNGVSTMVSHSEGLGCNSFYNAHAEGCATSALFCSHTEGMFTHGDYASHAEGIYSSAIDTSHAEGLFTNAYNKSHAEGFKTLSMGQHSHAQGVWTVTSNEAEHAEGMFNKSNTGSEEKDITLSSIGIGSSVGDRKNAVEVMQNGDMYVYGVGNYDGTNPSEASTLQTVIDNLNGSSGTGGSCDITVATDSALGGIKIGYQQTEQNYPVVLDSNNKAYVNVPWVPGESGDTKNTAGATNSESDLFIIGSLDQSDNPQTYSNANIKISGNAIKASGGFYQESDERLKDFTEDIQVDLEQLSQLPKKHFTWKNDSKKETQIGTSAQELQKLYPELVKEDSNGTLSVAYDKLSIIALKAIDELYKRNIELEKRIQELENK